LVDQHISTHPTAGILTINPYKSYRQSIAIARSLLRNWGILPQELLAGWHAAVWGPDAQDPEIHRFTVD